MQNPPYSFKRQTCLVIAIALSVSAVLYSCRKLAFDDTATLLETKAKVHPVEIQKWLESLPNLEGKGKAKTKANAKRDIKTLAADKIPLNIKWDKAQQKVIDGKHTVRVPISENSYFIFSKDSESVPITVYGFKVKDETKLKNEKEFSGKIMWVNCRDLQVRSQRFKEGISRPIIIHKNSTNEKGKASTKSIGSFFASIWCFLTGGSWSQVSEGSWWCDYANSGSGSGSETVIGGGYTPATGTFSYQVYQGYTIDYDSGGTGGSNGWSPYSLTITNNMVIGDLLSYNIGGYSGTEDEAADQNYWAMTFPDRAKELIIYFDMMELYQEDRKALVKLASDYYYFQPEVSWEDFKSQHLFNSSTNQLLSYFPELPLHEMAWAQKNTFRIDEILYYLANSTLPLEEKKAIAKAHLIQMTGNADYLTFVQSYAQFASTSASTGNNGASTEMWWENEFWLFLGDNLNYLFEYNYIPHAANVPSAIPLMVSHIEPIDVSAFQYNLTDNDFSNATGISNNNTSVIGFNVSILFGESYSDSHPVSVAVRNFNEYVWLAFKGSNNTSLKHFHDHAKGLAGTDAYGKAIGAIGEGLFGQRLTSVPSVSLVRAVLGGSIARPSGSPLYTDIITEQHLPEAEEGYSFVNMIYTDLSGNQKSYRIRIQRNSQSKLIGFTRINKGLVAYEVKTNNPSSSIDNLYSSFKEGVKQAMERGFSQDMTAGVLVFDKNAFQNLYGSSKRAEVQQILRAAYAKRNINGQPAFFMRLETDLWQESQNAYFALKGLIDNL